MNVSTKHVGYDRHDVIVNGEVIGRVWMYNGKYRLRGWVKGVQIEIFDRDSMEEAIELCAAMYQGGGLL